MPKEMKEIDDLTDEILNRTLEVYTKVAGDFIKYKFRTKSTLYTLKVIPDEISNLETRINSVKNIDIIPV